MIYINFNQIAYKAISVRIRIYNKIEIKISKVEILH